MMISLTDKILRATIAVVASPLTLVQWALSAWTHHQYKKQGSMIDVGNHRLHTVVTGENDQLPTVILESGMGGCALDWSLVQPHLSKYTKVLSYDRAGFGWSTQTINKATCEEYVADLRMLLLNLQLKPPYVLVGHSYGGMIMRLFASKFPDEVKGIILVDSTHEKRFLDTDTSKHRKTKQAKHRKQLRLGYLLSPIALPRFMKQHIGSKRLPLHLQKKASALGYRNNAYKAAYLEFLSTVESAEQLMNSKPLRSDMPILVLTAGQQSDEWKEDQKELLSLSQNTQHTIIENSWHSIQIHQPQAVIDSVMYLLKMD